MTEWIVGTISQGEFRPHDRYYANVPLPITLVPKRTVFKHFAVLFDVTGNHLENPSGIRDAQPDEVAKATWQQYKRIIDRYA